MTEPFGGLPTRFEPDGTPVGLGLILSGSAYGPAQPLLDAPGSWLTPLLTRPEVVDAIRANPARQLLVGGTEDPLWNADVAADLASSGCDVLQVEGLDHGLVDPADPVHSAEALVEATRAMVWFLAG